MSAPRPTALDGVGTGSWREWLSGGRLLILLGLLSLLIGLASLSVPATPSYDPWSWLVWGKEIVHHGSLHTQGGPSWKPLPMLFTTPFGLFGHLQPNLWIVVARSGAVMALLMCFRLAWRLVRDFSSVADGAGRAVLWIAPLIAGLIAAGSLLNAPGFVSNQALGYSEGLAVALMLCAAERLLDGRRDWAFILGFFVALDRPEIWAAWIPFGIWLAWKDASARRLVIALIVLNFLLWFGPAGVSAVTRAQHPRTNSAAFTSCPLCTVFRHQAWPMVLNRIKVPAIIGALVAVGLLLRSRALWWRTTPDKPSVGRLWLIGMAVFGFGWWLGIAVETQAGGFSGNSRYLAFGTAAVGIAGGAAWGRLVEWIAVQLGRLRSKATSLAAFARTAVAVPAGAVLSVGLFLAVPPWIGKNVISLPKTHHALVDQAMLRENLNQLVALYGGVDKINACGTAMTEGFQVPMVAWTLGLRTLQVTDEPSPIAEPGPGAPASQKRLYAQELVGKFPASEAPNVIFQARDRPGDTLLPLPDTILHWDALGVHFKEIAHIGTFWLFTHCK